MAPHHAPQVNTPNAAGLPPRHPAFRQTVNQPFNQATLGESPRQQVCQLDAVNLSDLSVPDERNQLQTRHLMPVSIHQIQISRWRFGQKNVLFLSLESSDHTSIDV